MDGYRVREGPDHGARLGVTERRAAVLDCNSLDAAREVGFPVLALGSLLLFRGQVIPPPKFFQYLVAELRVTILDFRALAEGSLGQQIGTVAFDTEARPEGQSTLGNRFRRIVKIRRTGMVHLRRAPGRPWQAVEITIGRSTFCLEAGVVEGAPVFLVFLQTFWALASVADGPHAAVDFAQHVLDQRLVVFDLDILEHLVGNAEFLRQLVHDDVIGQRFEQRIDDFRTPLERTVGRGHRTVGFHLGGSR